MGKKISDKTKAEIVNDYIEGSLSIVKICNKYNVSRDFIYKCAVKEKEKIRLTQIIVPLEEKEKWWKDYKAGLKLKELSEKYCRPSSTINNFLTARRKELIASRYKAASEPLVTDIKCEKTVKLYPPIYFCRYNQKWYYDITNAPSEDGLTGYFGGDIGSKKVHHDWLTERQVIPDGKEL